MLAKDFTIACYAVGFDPMMDTIISRGLARLLSGAGLDGALSRPIVDFGGGECNQHAHGHGVEFYDGGAVSCSSARGAEGILSRL